MDKTFDLIVYGATGFTGRQVAQYLDQHGNQIRWAIAGRNPEKLKGVQATLNTKVAIFIADSADQAAVDHFVSQARVVLTTAGPFAKYGEPLAKACVEFGTHYLDITGETPYGKRLIDRYHESAQDKGVKLIPFCGFDSVPSDLGSYFLARETKKHLGESLSQVKGFFKVFGGFNGGTLASVLNLLEEGNLKALSAPDLLTPAHAPHRGGRDPLFLQFDTDLLLWTAPFFMAPVNTRVVRRSAALFELKDQPYGSGFTYDEYMYFDEILPFKTLAVSTALAIMGSMGSMALLPGAPALLKPLLPKPGTGPAEAQRKKGFFKTWLFGKTESGKKVKACVHDTGDPGNEVTVKILCEAALALVLQESDLPTLYAGGVLTPASALGDVLVERLVQQGMGFDWVT